MRPGGSEADGGAECRAAGTRRRNRQHVVGERGDGYPLDCRLQCLEGRRQQPHQARGRSGDLALSGTVHDAALGDNKLIVRHTRKLPALNVPALVGRLAEVAADASAWRCAWQSINTL